MTPEPLDLLRVANPVPQAVAYADDVIATQVADILERDGELPAVLGAGPVRRSALPRWLAGALVAAAVLVLAAVSAVVFTRRNAADDAAGASPVTCAVSTSGGSRAVDARLKQAETAISERVRASGGSARSFVTDADDGSIGFTPHGVSARAVAAACRASTVAIRPLVAPSVRVDARSPRSSHPLSALRFAIPSDDAAYARLTAAQRTALAGAMSHADCTPATVTTTSGLACSTVPGPTQVMLLGPSLITGPDVASASAVGPTSGKGGSTVDWTVQLRFRTAGATRFTVFTGAHHTDSTSATVSDCGSAGGVPCGDFLAITAVGRILSVPVTNAVLDSSVQISGDFTEASAQTLAGEATAAAVQLHPR